MAQALSDVYDRSRDKGQYSLLFFLGIELASLAWPGGQELLVEVEKVLVVPAQRSDGSIRHTDPDKEPELVVRAREGFDVGIVRQDQGFRDVFVERRLGDGLRSGVALGGLSRQGAVGGDGVVMHADDSAAGLVFVFQGLPLLHGGQVFAFDDRPWRALVRDASDGVDQLDVRYRDQANLADLIEKLRNVPLVLVVCADKDAVASGDGELV